MTINTTTMPPRKQKTTHEHRLAAAIAYIGILFLIPLLFQKDSAFAQFHAKQGLAIFLCEVIALFLSLTFVLAWLALLIYLFCFFASAYGFFMAAAGKQRPIPGIRRMVHHLNI